MRESNFAFPPQNRACVCITSQLYDRRALDATSALPLYNSLTHLVYLTSTSPRIREILTLDGGLERLVRILRDFCANPPARKDATWIYALSPPAEDLPRRIEHRISPPTFESDDEDDSFYLESASRAELEKRTHRPRPPSPHPTHTLPYIPTPGVPFPYVIDPLAARTFSLAFQSVVNIGVRGSEHIRRRVVQAGALGVVSCILAVWLKGKGFAIGPSATGSGAPRESREVRVRRREEALERQRALDLARALDTASRRQQPPASSDEEMTAPVRMGAVGRSMSNDSDASFAGGIPVPGPSIRIGRAISPTTAQSSDASANATPVGSGTPTGSVVVPGRDRSGTVVGRPVWDDAPPPPPPPTVPQDTQTQPMTWEQPQRWPEQELGTGRRGTITRRPVRPDTDGDETEEQEEPTTAERRTIGIVDAADGDGAMAMEMIEGGQGIGVVALEQNDDLAMGAPPGAPGAIATTPRPRVPGNELTPRAGLAPLEPAEPVRRAATSVPSVNPGPYGDEEVLFSLQLLAYLSKYPHVRQAFYETPQSLLALIDRSSESPNVFSLVERFTFRPSPSETTLPRLPNEIQYWAGVIMRNACRKDDQRNGIRQCANMLCGRWEEFPREFAKCRRCRKAKYCGKECQSKAWAEGHRFWCSAREEDDAATVVGRREPSGTTPAAVATEVEVPTRRLTAVSRAWANFAGGVTGRAATPTTTPTPPPATARRNVPTARPGPVPVPTPRVRPSGGGTSPTGSSTSATSAATSWSRQTPTEQDAGPSRQRRTTEAARRRSGTMPSESPGWRVVPVERVDPPLVPHTTPLQTSRALDEEDVMIE